MRRYLLMLAACASLLACTSPAVVPAQAVAAAPQTLDLATLHEEVGKLDCKDCHGAAKPKSVPAELALKTVNERCVACHGSMATVSNLIKPRLSNPHINPHDSHVVSIECVSCHLAHDRPSQAYCLGCHAFDMPMQLSRAPRAK